LDDLDWRAGRSVLRGNAFRKDGIPLPAYVRRRSAVMPWWSSVMVKAAPISLSDMGESRRRCGLG